MLLEFNAEKNEQNVRKRGLGFECVADLDLNAAVFIPDSRRDYGEPRIMIAAPLYGRLHVAVVTPRGERIRVISLRRANTREEKTYGKARP
jgi:uncharacterized protein